VITTTRSRSWAAAALVLSTAFAACDASPATSAAGAAPPQAQAAPAGVPAPRVPEGGTFTGVVAETMNSGGYTYLRLEEGGRSVWAAALEFPAKTGERLTVPLESPMADFTSRTLNRTFPVIYFVSRVTRDGETLSPSAGSEAPGMAASHGASPGGAPEGGAAAIQVEPIAPPTGGLSIADVWAKRQALGGTRVSVRGKVVKVNNGILGRNWLHLQDGSGAGSAGTHDLTVTTDATVQVGDVVTATGTLVLDKDFGAGYAYEVLLEGATVLVAQAAH
jgi:hypothetical protein